MPMYGGDKKSQQPPVGPMPQPAPPPMDFQTLMQQRFGGMYGSADVRPSWLGPSPTTTGYGYPSIGLGQGPLFPPPAPVAGMPSAPPLPKMPSAPPLNPITGGERPPLAAPQGIFRQLYQTGKQVGGAAGEALMARARPPLPAEDPLAGVMPQRPVEEPPRQRVPNLPPPAQAPDPRQMGRQPQGRQPQGRNPAAPHLPGRIGQRLADRQRRVPMPRSRRSPGGS